MDLQRTGRSSRDPEVEGICCHIDSYRGLCQVDNSQFLAVEGQAEEAVVATWPLLLMVLMVLVVFEFCM